MNVSGTLAATIVWVSDHCEWRLGGIFFSFAFFVSFFLCVSLRDFYSLFLLFFTLFILLFFVGLFGRPLVRLSDCLAFLSE